MLFVTQLVSFLSRRLLGRTDAAPEEPHWHFDREHGAWVEHYLERHAA